jgi:hypothetical protein
MANNDVIPPKEKGNNGDIIPPKPVPQPIGKPGLLCD